MPPSRIGVNHAATDGAVEQRGGNLQLLLCAGLVFLRKKGSNAADLVPDTGQPGPLDLDSLLILADSLQCRYVGCHRKFLSKRN